jgi:hypothetical protein
LDLTKYKFNHCKNKQKIKNKLKKYKLHDKISYWIKLADNLEQFAIFVCFYGGKHTTVNKQ